MISATILVVIGLVLGLISMIALALMMVGGLATVGVLLLLRETGVVLQYPALSLLTSVLCGAVAVWLAYKALVRR